jgi:hypothetical protein
MTREVVMPLDEREFPLTLGAGLRRMFADFASEPIPEKLATLLSRLDVDEQERSDRCTAPEAHRRAA